MGDSCREQLGWNVSAELWARFEDRVASEWGATSPYTGIQIEQSWREYHSDGGRHPLEEVSEEIVVATGRAPSDVREKSLRTGINVEAETTTVWVRVHEDIKGEMAAFANASHVPKRAVLRAVLTWYLDGGRDARVLEKLEGVVDDIETAFESLREDSATLNKTERTTRAIAAHLGDAFNEDALASAIDAETSGSDYYHTEYPPRVIELKDVKRLSQEDEPDVFLPPEKWQSRKAGEIIRALGRNQGLDVAGPFTKQDYVEAADKAGFDPNVQSDEINEILDRILDRLNFRWNEDSEQFEPITDGDDELSTNGNSTSASTVD